ncbi:MAG: hypothetical protein ABIG68_13900, partial [Acidobacteriota bacterium]
MKSGFLEYIRHAFHARPIGMFIPPNWIGIAAFAMLGVLNPGFWVLGFGLELAYLGMMATHPRFQRYVDAVKQWEARKTWQGKVDAFVQQLDTESQRRYRALEVRCRSILEQQLRSFTLSSGLDAQGEGLGRLLWIFLRLLLTRQGMDRMVRESEGASEKTNHLADRIENLEARLKEEALGEELRHSLSGQVEILQQRMEKRREARQKLAFLDAELTRIQEQAELIREQAVLATNPDLVSQR